MKSRFAIAVVLSLLFATVAFGQATRTWVSGVGDDVNPCSRTAPCKTFAGAISKTAAGGQISVLDPGGFGGVTINKSMTIDGTGVVASILNASSTSGIIINATNTDRVIIKNIEIDGAGTGLNGIRVIQAKTVVVDSVSIMNQQAAGGRGIAIEPTVVGSVKVFLNNVQIYNTAAAGIHINGSNSSTSILVANNVQISGAGTDGILTNTITSAAYGGQLTNVTVVNSGGSGVHLDGAGNFTIDACTFTRNGADGLTVGNGASTAVVNNSNSNSNTLAGFKQQGSGVLNSYKNNRSFNNGSADNGGAQANFY